MMKAAVLESHGAPFKLATVAKPIAAAGQVLVRIKASGVNPLDTKIRSGNAAHARHPLPAVLGMDMAGTVEAVGSGVTSFRVSDDVYGFTGGVGGVQGSLAEYAAVDAALLAKMPRNLTMREAAALPLSVITAWEGLIDRADVRPGQKVLVHGGAGGVGHVVVQLAVAKGATVFATGTAAQKTVIESFGATAIDFEKTKPDEYLSAHTGGKGFDVVYDTVGGAVLDSSFAVARLYGGHVVSCLGWGTHQLAPLSFRAATYSGVFTLIPLTTGQGRARHGQILGEATALIEAGKLAPLVDSNRFDLQTVNEAHLLAESGRALGKVVVDVQT
ncbi:MAG: putative zinc-type alcohol dehydrogenase [Polaromonas sp.]|nr:putative zinc-type alcohol dehydrogenase [Polaromonas sp.]